MKKDEQLENLMSEYFDGFHLSETLLIPAKRALAQRKTRRPFYLRIGAAVSFACIALMVCLSIGLGKINSDQPVPPAAQTYYAADTLSAERSSFAELKTFDEDVFDPFTVLETSSHAQADYYAYYDKQSGSLMYAEIKAKILTDVGMQDVTFRIEFAENATYEGFSIYYDLPDEKHYHSTEVLYRTQYVDAEWVSSGFFEKNSVKYFIDVTSPEHDSFDFIVGFLLS